MPKLLHCLSPDNYKALVCAALLAGMTGAFLLDFAVPEKYSATARVLLPAEAGDVSVFAAAAESTGLSADAVGASRLVRLRAAARDAGGARTALDSFVAAHVKRPMVLVDGASVSRDARPGIVATLLLGAGAGALAGGALVAVLRRLRRASAATREPQAEGPDYRALCTSLLRDWFVSHPMLALVGTGTREERAQVAARLAVSFAELGAKTLLVDGAPAAGAQGVKIRPVEGSEQLFLLGAAPERLAAILADARRRFRVVLVDAAEERFATLAGGVVVIARDDTDHAARTALENALTRLRVRVLATVAPQGVAKSRQAQRALVVNT